VPELAPIVPTARAIYSDDVRQEAGNKLSLMGVYQTALIVPTLPFVLPKLCIFVEALTLASQPFHKLLVQVLSNRDVIISGEIDTDTANIAKEAWHSQIQEDERVMRLSLVMQVAPFSVTEDRVIRTRITTESEVLRAGALVIRHQPTQVDEAAATLPRPEMA